jgi:hypothetical protein
MSHGLVYSQRVLLKLTDAGLARQVAYELVQKNAMRAWKERRPFFELLAADRDVTSSSRPTSSRAASIRRGTCATSTPCFKRSGAHAVRGTGGGEMRGERRCR